MRYSRVLLIFPHYYFSIYKTEPYLDAGLGYVSEALTAAGIENKVLDMAFDSSRKALHVWIRGFKPDLIGISMRSLNFKDHYAFANAIKESYPEIHIVAGGPHVSTLRGNILKDCNALDYGITLEGEITLVELCQGQLSLNEIKGLLYRGENDVIYTGDRQFNNSIDTLPIPTYSSFDLEKYSLEYIPIVSSRGCPYKCIYCPVKVTIGRQYRPRDPILVADEIEWWHRKGFRAFDFTDDNFTMIPDRVYGFCDEIEKRKLKDVLFSCGNGIRADKVEWNLLKKMKKVGFYKLAFGVEAGNNQILKNIRKGESLKEIEQAIAWACELGFQVKLTFLIGSPGETLKDINESMKLAIKYPVWKFNFFNIIPFPGTDLYNWITENNYWVVDPPNHLNEVQHWSNIVAFETPEMSRKERSLAYEITHRFMDQHWCKVDRAQHRNSRKAILQTAGFPPWMAKVMAFAYHNNFMPFLDKKVPVLARFFRLTKSKIMNSIL